MTERNHTATFKGNGPAGAWLVLGADDVDGLIGSIARAFRIEEETEDDERKTLAEIMMEAQGIYAALQGAAPLAPTVVGHPPAPQGFPAQAPAPAAGPAAPAGGETVSLPDGPHMDQYGGKYEANLPGAPLSPYGPAVKKTWKAQSGNVISRWVDPRLHPAYQGRKPKKEEAWPGDWAR